MNNQVALITGSTSGIGLGIAKKFAIEKYNIIINGFANEAEITKIKADLTKLGAKEVLYSDADLTNSQKIRDMFALVANKFQKLDILVNNAGTQFVSPIEEFPDKEWEQIIQLNLVSNFYTIKAALPMMKKNDFGRIINIASTHAHVASPFKSAYVSAKHGILGLTKTVALEVARDNITVNAICPGYVKTPLVLGQIADTAKSRGISEEEVIENVILGAQATKKFVEIDEIADLCLYLSRKAAASITGTSLILDGGWTAQ